jgi:hypothetical protein
MRKHLFVCGVELSGASATASWLSSCNLITLGIERYIKYWETHRAFPSRAFEAERFFNPQAGDSWCTSLDQFSDHYARMKANFDSAVYVGDNIPALWQEIPSTIQAFPDAKIICVLRDPFSVAASWKARALDQTDMTWGAHREVLHSIVEWNRAASKIVQFFRSTPTARQYVYLLDYEKLINNIVSRDELSLFLEIPRLASSLPDITITPQVTNSVDLTEIERGLVQNTLDTSALESIRRIQDDQATFFLQRIWSMEKKEKMRDWYHGVDRDVAGIRYGETVIEGCNYLFRGRSSDFDPNQPYIVCMGSATTFGRFIKQPFSDSLEHVCSIQCLNLGIGGARIESFLAVPALVKIVQGAQLVILELMSARGYASPVFLPQTSVSNLGKFRDFYNLHLKQLPYLEHLKEVSAKPSGVFVDRIYEFCIGFLDNAERARIRDCLVYQYLRDLRILKRLLEDTPIISLLMTRNEPYQARLATPPKNYQEWSGYHPHFVDEPILTFCQNLGMEPVVSRSTRGVPFTVKHWDTGLPAPVHPWQEDPSLNTYYPSQEMHDDATAALLASSTIRDLLARLRR